MLSETSSVSTILVPLDGSPTGELAAAYAERIARATGASMLLACVVESDGQPLAELERYLNTTAQRLTEKGMAVRTSILMGDATPAILDAVGRESVQLVVLASDAQSAVTRWHYATDIEVVLQTTVPFLLVPERTQCNWLGERSLTMLVALDGSAMSEVILGPALELALRLRAGLGLVHVVDPAVGGELRGDPAILLKAASAYLDEVARRLRSQGAQVRTCAELGRPGHTIPRLAHELHADMLAIATHWRDDRLPQVLGSVSAEVLEKTDIPVLLVRPAAAATAR